MSVLARKNGSDKNVLFVKGAPEKILDSASFIQIADGTSHPITNSDKDYIQGKVNSMCNRGLRVIAIAIKEETGDLANFDGINDKKHPKIEFLKDSNNYSTIEQGSTLLGFIGISDPVRKEVPKSIDLCK